MLEQNVPECVLSFRGETIRTLQDVNYVYAHVCCSGAPSGTSNSFLGTIQHIWCFWKFTFSIPEIQLRNQVVVACFLLQNMRPFLLNRETSTEQNMNFELWGTTATKQTLCLGIPLLRKQKHAPLLFVTCWHYKYYLPFINLCGLLRWKWHMFYSMLLLLLFSPNKGKRWQGQSQTECEGWESPEEKETSGFIR